MSKTAFTVRPYDDTTDRDEVIALWDETLGYTAAHNRSDASIDRKLAYGDGLFFVAVSRGLDGRDAAVPEGALSEACLLGTIMAGYDGHRGWIYSLAVAPGSRGLGVGSALLERTERELEALGCVKINLQVRCGNEAARAFYEKHGYEVQELIHMGKVVESNLAGPASAGPR